MRLVDENHPARKFRNAPIARRFYPPVDAAQR